jgi:hypothetical protein
MVSPGAFSQELRQRASYSRFEEALPKISPIGNLIGYEAAYLIGVIAQGLQEGRFLDERHDCVSIILACLIDIVWLSFRPLKCLKVGSFSEEFRIPIETLIHGAGSVDQGIANTFKFDVPIFFGSGSDHQTVVCKI